AALRGAHRRAGLEGGGMKGALLRGFRVWDVLALRVRGFRVVDLAAMVVFLALALTVYAVKTAAGRQSLDIHDIENQIHDDKRQVRLLRADVARLESPERLERLATEYAGMAPITARQEIQPDALSQAAGPAAGREGAAP
ncbi:MAG: cell division protein FtsL, partial [Caulobacteraceae bacterium]